MKSIYSIAKDSIREMSRRKLLLAILIAGILTAFLFVIITAILPIVAEKTAANFLKGQNSPGTMEFMTKEIMEKGYKLLVSCFSLAIEVLGVFLAILTFSTFLPTEIDRGTIKLIISKPVSRSELVLGKYLGGTIVLFCYTLIMGILLVLSSLYLTGKIEPADGYQAGFIFFKLLMRGSIAMALSMVIRPIIASIITIFLAGDIFATVAMLFSKTAVIYYPSAILYYILPSYSLFDTKTLGSFLGISNPNLSLPSILCKAGYGIDIALIMVIATIVLFEKKDLIQ